MTDEDALYNSVYIMIGLAYNWSVSELSDFYGVTPAQFDLWLSEMGFDRFQVKLLRGRRGFERGRCRYCGVLTQAMFCRSACVAAYDKRNILLLEYTKTKRIPSAIFRNLYYNITTGKIENDKD